ncbi:hypothetical protein GJV08_11625 [Enterobacteriaceae bacterium RIT692]|nr:hypothetical protein [Enterobacteriaceae bacterium RIT692]
MEWFNRMILGLPPRAKDVKELKDSAPELFSNDNSDPFTPIDHFFGPHFYWTTHELRDSVKIWVQSYEDIAADRPEEGYCDHPHCLRKKGISDVEGYMQMMTVAGGKDRNPPAKSFFDLINATKIKNTEVARVILTDPFIYSDIGQTGEGGGFSNLLILLENLTNSTASTFELQLTPQNNVEKKDKFENSIKQKFPNCTVSNHKNSSTFHDRFIFVQYANGFHKAWYGPSLNGLGSNSIIIFGDLTDNNAVTRLSQMLM